MEIDGKKKMPVVSVTITKPDFKEIFLKKPVKNCNYPERVSQQFNAICNIHSNDHVLSYSLLAMILAYLKMKA